MDDLMPQILWMQYLLEAQGMKVSDNAVYQDNQDAMKLEKNGRASIGKKTQHINICYFLLLIAFRQKKRRRNIFQRK